MESKRSSVRSQTMNNLKLLSTFENKISPKQSNREFDVPPYKLGIMDNKKIVKPARPNSSYIASQNNDVSYCQPQDRIIGKEVGYFSSQQTPKNQIFQSHPMSIITSFEDENFQIQKKKSQRQIHSAQIISPSSQYFSPNSTMNYASLNPLSPSSRQTHAQTMTVYHSPSSSIHSTETSKPQKQDKRLIKSDKEYLESIKDEKLILKKTLKQKQKELNLFKKRVMDSFQDMAPKK